MPAVAWLLVLRGARRVARSSRTKRAAVGSSIGAFAVAIGAHLVGDRRLAPAGHDPRRSASRGRSRSRSASPSRCCCARGRCASPIVARGAPRRERSPDRRRCATRNGSSAARPATSAISTSRRAGASRELKPQRVLVGDAGALLYASDRPGLDIIGLGGYHELPFARAGVHGLAATLELIERMPDAERPDVLRDLPDVVGRAPDVVRERRRSRASRAEGNVICGGYEDVIYRADWHVLGTGDRIRASPDRRRVRRRGRRRRSRERAASTATRSRARRAAGRT